MNAAAKPFGTYAPPGGREQRERGKIEEVGHVTPQERCGPTPKHDEAGHRARVRAGPDLGHQPITPLSKFEDTSSDFVSATDQVAPKIRYL